MRIAIRTFRAALLLAVASTVVAAQSETPPKPDSAAVKGFEGTWTGSMNMQGQEMGVTCVIKKDKDSYVGTITGMQGDMSLYDIKVEGNKLTAVATVQTPNGNIDVYYTFMQKDDTLTGQAEASFNGQSFALPVMMKRVSGP